MAGLWKWPASYLDIGFQGDCQCSSLSFLLSSDLFQLTLGDTKQKARLFSVATGDCLVIWPSGSTGGLSRSQPAPREQRHGGDYVRPPKTRLSPWHTTHSTRPDAVGQMRLPIVAISQYLDEMWFKRAPTENYTTSHSFSIEKLKHSSGSFAAQLGNPIHLPAPWNSRGENLNLRPTLALFPPLGTCYLASLT